MTSARAAETPSSDAGKLGRSRPAIRRESAGEVLADRLKLLILIRVVTVTLISVVTLVFELQGKPSILAGASDRFLYFVTTGVYILCLGYTVLLRVVQRPDVHRLHAYVQVTFDILFVTILVFLTRLTDSVFTFLFSIAIVGASILLQHRGLLFAAGTSTLAFFGIAVLQWNLGAVIQFLDHLGAPSQFLIRSAELASLSMRSGIVYNLAINVLAFFSIGLLASYLAAQVQRTGLVLHQNRLSLEALRALHQNVVSSLPVGLVTTDTAEAVTYVNPEGLTLCGLEAGAMVGRPVTVYFPDLKAILANEDKLQGHASETTVQVMNGRQVHLRWTISPLRSTAGERIGQLFVFQDVTTLVRMEAESKRKDRLATVGRLAAGIAHEIRNPLASISGSIQLLRHTLTLSAEDARLMDIVVRETDSLNERITDFLAYARPRKLEMRTVDLVEVVQETLEVFRHDRRAEQLTLAFHEPSPEEPRIEGDRDRLKQVFWNLLCNAAEATPAGGTITVGLTDERHDGAPFLALWVRDTGCGIPREDLKRIMEPFYTTKEGGTGLGLAMVQRVVEEHSGWLRVESKLHVGSTFWVYVPREAAPAPIAEEDADLLGRVLPEANLPIMRAR